MVKVIFTGTAYISYTYTNAGKTLIHKNKNNLAGCGAARLCSHHCGGRNRRISVSLRPT